MGVSVKDNIKIEFNDDIFKYLYPNSNIILSEVSNSDRIHIMYLIKQYYLTLRDKLGISEDDTFGIEIEFEQACREIIERDISKDYDDWKVVDDDSLINGGEINSPKLSDSRATWIDLSLVCDIVDKNAYVMDNTGGHIHIGMHILGNNPKYWANFAKLWMTYENVIFRFLYGEFISHRSKILDQARPISQELINNIDRINDRVNKINASDMFRVLDIGENKKQRRKRSVNFTNVFNFQPYQYNESFNKNTIEFRGPNGTFDPIIWQNNVNLLVHLFMYAKSDKFDENIINKRLLQVINNDIPSNLYKYSRIYNEQAIELADLIFDNNLDKIYFLRQYIKDGMVSSKTLVRSRCFTSR